jgi:hypothetical protein
MSMYQQDKRGTYQVLHDFVKVGAGHAGGNGWCRRCELRRYEDGRKEIAEGPIVGINDRGPEFRALLAIYAEAKLALECLLESPK